MCYIIHLTGKFLNGTMFKFEHFEKFYEFTSDPHFQVSIEVKNAYVIFLSDFCKYSSHYWSKYINPENIEKCKHNCGFKSNLTISDEAIVYWLIKYNYNTAKTNSEAIERLSEEVWKKQRNSRKRGKHDSKLYYDDYRLIFKQIKNIRSEKDSLKYWESVFFEGLYNFSEKNKNENCEEQDDHDETFESNDVLLGK